MQRWLDRATIVLACASLVVFVAVVTGSVASLYAPVVMALDLAIVAIYAIVFALEGLLDERPARWFRRHAWLALALLPITLPVLTAQPYFLLVQVVILVARAAKALDRALHLHVAEGLSQRYRARLTEELSQPLLLTLTNALDEAIAKADLTTAIGTGLRERRDQIEVAVRRGIESSPRLSRFARVPAIQRFVDETTGEVVDAAHAALTSREMNDVLRASLRDALAELKHGIEQPKWQEKGIGVREAVRVVLHAGHAEPKAPTPVPVSS